jgi:UDPglucose--hexose-1-phosphate uridylyltransferase
MPELRQDRFTKEWVFVASENIKHPQELVVPRARKSAPSFDPNCPFCPGHESRTSPEILRVPSPKGGWTLRVIPRKFAGLSSDLPESNFAPAIEGFGIHEIIVETPDHSLSTALLPEPQLLSLLRNAKARYDEICLDPRIAYATIYKKHTVEGSGGPEHSHSHLIASQVIPPPVAARLQQARRHYGQTGDCIFCAALQEELDAQSRIVAATQHFIAIEPFASPSPFCTQIYPRRHMANFGEINGEELLDFARILRTILSKFYSGLENPDFTYNMRSSPVANAGVNYYHWCLHLVPNLPIPGLEQEGKMLLNPVLPEEAAQFLREVRVKQAIPA